MASTPAKPTGMAIVMVSWCVAIAVVSAQLPTPAQRQETLQYLYALKKSDGSYGADVAAAKGDVPTTSAVVRAIVYFGGQVPDAEKTGLYLRSCQQEDGGFAAQPGGSSDVRVTALAVLGLVELGERDKTVFTRAAEYLERHAKTFEEIRIAAAAFEAMSKRPSSQTLAAWERVILQDRNADGTFGQGDDIARETGSAVACLLRLGLGVEHTERVAKVLVAGQRADGGWGRAGQPSELETTYRVLRALYMLKHRPDVNAVAKFVARCRCPNGGYALRPGENATPQATYFASAILRWVEHWSR